MTTRTFCLLVLVALATTLAHAQVYRWVDDHGQVHYGDKPPGEAERVAIPEPTVVPSVPPRRAERDTGENPGAGSIPDWHIAIEQPAAEATVRDNRGRLTVSLRIVPGPRAGQAVRLLLDGRKTAGSPYDAGNDAGAGITLSALDRGAHELQAVLLDASGAPLARSEPVTFYLHQASRLLPGGQGDQG